MKKILFILLAVLATTYCSAQNTKIKKLKDSEFKQFEEYLKMDSLHVVQITDDHEPGTQLIICGTVSLISPNFLLAKVKPLRRFSVILVPLIESCDISSVLS